MIGGQLLGITGQPAAGGGANLQINFNSDECGCVTPDSDSPGGSVTWESIIGRPDCILDCNTLMEYIHEHGLFNLRDSDEIVVQIDGQGIYQLYLAPRGIVEATYGSASKTVTVTVNEKGVVTAIEEQDIEIAAGQVTYTNTEYPLITNLEEMLDQLVLIATRQTYVHTQSVASMTWTIAHNLGRRPSVTIIDAAGDLSVARIAYTDLNNLTLTFSEAITGTAYLN